MTAARTFLTTRKKKKSRDEATNIAVKRLEKSKRKIVWEKWKFSLANGNKFHFSSPKKGKKAETQSQHQKLLISIIDIDT
jgi:hypothetical protein